VGVPENTICGPFDRCTNTWKVCQQGACVTASGGPPPNCDDGNACTTDWCDTYWGCVSRYDAAICAPGVPQNGYNVVLLEPTPGYYRTFPNRINDSGTVVGISTDAVATCAQGFQYTPEQGTTLVGATDRCSFADDINNRGEIALTEETAPGSGEFVTSKIVDGQRREIGPSRRSFAPSFDGQEVYINDAGQVAGTYVTGAVRPWRYSDASGLQDLGTLPGGDHWVRGIDSSGRVFGYYAVPLWWGVIAHGWLFTDGVGLQDLNTLTSPVSSLIFGNAAGSNGLQIVGSGSRWGWDDPRGVFMSDGTLTDVLPFGAWTSYGFAAINKSGHAVGQLSNYGGTWTSHAFLYTQRSGTLDLNRLIDPSLNITLLTAKSINNRGQIVGDAFANDLYWQGHRVRRAFIATPVNPCAFANDGDLCTDGNDANGTEICQGGACVSGDACAGYPQPTATVDEGDTATVACPAGQTITEVTFASFGTPTGSCRTLANGTCHATTSLAAVQSACTGRRSCSVAAGTGVFGDPCPGTSKRLSIRVRCSPCTPTTCAAQGKNCGSISDGCGETLQCGTCPASQVCGTGGAANVCGDGACAEAAEGDVAILTCPAGKTISAVNFASFGTPTGSCGGFAIGSCHAVTSLDAVQAACIGKASCSVAASNAFFGDPCAGTYKQLKIQAACSDQEQAPPDGAPCDDGDACTLIDTYQDGQCIGSGSPDCDDANPCTDDLCAPATGACVHTQAADNTPCWDGDRCNGDETCWGGVCQPGTPVVCYSPNPCRPHQCEPAFGTCAQGNDAPDWTDCSNGNACDGAEHCDGYGTCVAGTPLNCGDQDPCTLDSCDPAGGCAHTPAVACDDTTNGCEMQPDGTHPAGCFTGSPIVIDATDLGPGQFTLRKENLNDDPPVPWITTLDRSVRQTVVLRPNHLYYLEADGWSRKWTNLYVQATGVLDVLETDFVKGNGTDTLTIKQGRPAVAWEMEERFGKDDVMNFLPPQYDAPGRPRVDVNPSLWGVYLDFCGGSRVFDTEIAKYRWQITPNGGNPLPPQESTFCRNHVAFDALGAYTLDVSVQSTDGRWVSAPSEEMVLKDYLVVGMGDSYASGEGNPDWNNEELKLEQNTRDPQNRWSYAPKHLSVWSGHVQAALMLERSDPHSSVTFVSVAQSGANIINLTDEPQNPGYMPGVLSSPQIQDLKTLLCGSSPCEEKRKIDYILLSAGGNDAGFGPIIVECGLPFSIPGAGIHENCARGEADINDPYQGPSGIITYWDEFSGVPGGQPNPHWHGNQFTKGWEKAIENLSGSSDLPGSYARLNEKIRHELPVGPGTKVLIAEYPNPLVRDGNAPGHDGLCSELVLLNAGCGDARMAADCINGNVDHDEVGWVNDRIVIPLNSAIRETKRFKYNEDSVDWVPVVGMSEEFVGHAYCQATNFTENYWQSWSTEESLFGTMHPNEGGQEVIARYLADAMGVKRPFVTRPNIARTTKDDPPALCTADTAVVGASCQGDTCEAIETMCKPLRDGVTLGDPYWSRQISEETNGTFTTCRGLGIVYTAVEHGVNCGDGVMTGIRCTNHDCDDVELLCRPLATGHLENCYWTQTVSDETRWNVFLAGKVANGVRCVGPNCDNMSYYVCSVSPGNVPACPPAPPVPPLPPPPPPPPPSNCPTPPYDCGEVHLVWNASTCQCELPTSWSSPWINPR
jgi:hypothetical protein